MRKLLIPFFILGLVLLYGCSESLTTPSESGIDTITIYDLLVNNGNKESEPPYQIQDKYNGKTVYLKAKLREGALCSGPSMGCKGNNCEPDCRYTAVLYGDTTLPSDISSRVLNVKFNGQEIAYIKNGDDVLNDIKCSIKLEKNKYYLFKGKPDLQWYYAPDKDRLKLYWTGSFEIYECQELN